MTKHLGPSCTILSHWCNVVKWPNASEGGWKSCFCWHKINRTNSILHLHIFRQSPQRLKADIASVPSVSVDGATTAETSMERPCIVCSPECNAEHGAASTLKCMAGDGLPPLPECATRRRLCYFLSCWRPQNWLQRVLGYGCPPQSQLSKSSSFLPILLLLISLHPLPPFPTLHSLPWLLEYS